MDRLNAQQLRAASPTSQQLQQYRQNSRQIYLLLDNVYDTYNIGGLFRLADAVGASTVYLCGRTECPPNNRIFKSAVGTDRWVKWAYHSSALSLLNQLKQQIKNLQTVAVEQSPRSVSLADFQPQLPFY